MQGNTSVQVLAAGDSQGGDSAPATADRTEATSLPQMTLHKWCGKYAVSSDMFSEQTVGAKSLNTLRLQVWYVVATLCTAKKVLI